MLTLLLALLACKGEGDVATPTPPAEPPPAPAVAPTPAPPPAAPPETKALELDAPGGANGAPEGAAFVVPPGTQAEVVAGPLTGGATGMRMTVTAKGDALMCTQALPLGAQARVKARVRVADLKPGPQDWMGMNVELRARGAGGELISPSGSRYVLLRNLRADTDWTDVEANVATPAGATKGEVCFRFVDSLGTVEVDRVEVSGPATATDGGPAEVARWDLDQPGGGAGAPAGADFFVPQGAGAKTKIGDLGGGTGFALELDQAGNALACTQSFALTGKMQARGRVRARDVKSDARAWTGFVVELRAYDAGGTLVPAATMQYMPLSTVKAPGDWAEFAQPFVPPAGAANGKLCARFAEATGKADVDWLAVDDLPEPAPAVATPGGAPAGATGAAAPAAAPPAAAPTTP